MSQTYPSETAEIKRAAATSIEFDNRIYKHEARAVLKRVFRYLSIIGRHLTWGKIINFIKIELDYLLVRENCTGKPWSAKIEPTNVCNLQCTYCPREDTPYTLGMMSLERFRSLIDEIKDHTFIIALHLWGEPLLHKQLPEMIRYAVDSGIGTYISSNFNRLTDEQARSIIESKLDMLTICVDGSEQDTYEVFRKGGHLSKVLKNTETFIRIRNEMESKYPYVEMQFLVTPQTEHEIPRVRRLAEQLGVDTFKAKPVYPIMVERKGEFFMPEGEEYYPIKRREKRKTCWWLWRTITIGWEGSVLPCCRVMFASSMGNVFNTSLAEVWNNPKYQALRRTFRKGAEGAKPCDVCHVPYTSMHG
jgi:radical SAM protein with 4Fe4S-binding SPASM domain